MTKLFQEAYSNLRTKYYQRGLMIVVGSGLSVPFQLPDWSGLIREIGDRIHLSERRRQKIDKLLAQRDYLGATQHLLRAGLSERELQDQVVDIMRTAKAGKTAVTGHNYADLAEMSFSRFLTTNYDEYLNDYIKGQVFQVSELKRISLNQLSFPRYDGCIIPLHGDLHHPDQIVFSKSSYEKLYGSRKDLEPYFSAFRTNSIMLFLGFSFDDVYINALFEKLHAESLSYHYVLFEEGMRKQSDKLERLESRYGIKPIFYQAEGKDHSAGIRKALEQIRYFKDADQLESMPFSGKESLGEQSKTEEEKESGREKLLTGRHEKWLEAAERARKHGNMERALRYYLQLEQAKEFEAFPVPAKWEIYQGLLLCYGHLMEFPKANHYYNLLKKNEAYADRMPKLQIYYGQLLINQRKWDEAVAVLEASQEQTSLAKLLADIAAAQKYVLGERAKNYTKERMPTHEEHPWTPEQAADYHVYYLAMRNRYVSEQTLNLLRDEQYGEAHHRAEAYYWLGAVAGQVFHEYEDAIALLYRAYDLTKDISQLEELGCNYAMLGRREVQYRENAMYFEIDKKMLMKAKECLEIAIRQADSLHRKSIYKKSGALYLQILFDLKLRMAFYEAYPQIRPFYRGDAHVNGMKAAMDAEYLGRVSGHNLKYLPENTQICYRANACFKRSMSAQRRGEDQERQKYFQKGFELLEQAEDLCNDRSLLMLYLDHLFMAGRVKEFLHYKKIYTDKFGAVAVYDAYEMEYMGQPEKGEEILKDYFHAHPDVSTMSTLQNFYERYGRQQEVYELFREAERDYGQIIYDQDDFYAAYILTLFRQNRHQEAYTIYCRKWKEFQNRKLLMEVEETLRQYVLDFSNPDARIALMEELLEHVLREQAAELYFKIMQLLLHNLRFTEALEILEKAQKECRVLFLQEQIIAAYKRLSAYEKHSIACKRGNGQRKLLGADELIAVCGQEGEEGLKAYDKIQLPYAAVHKLIMLWMSAPDTPIIDMALRYAMNGENIELCAPTLPDFYELKTSHPEIRDREALQLMGIGREEL